MAGQKKGNALKAIVAVDKNWAIGKDGDLLFKLPGDMKFFRETTKGKVIVLGRKTLESFPGGKPLPGRVNVVLTRNKDYAPEGICVCHSLAEYEQSKCEQAECGMPCIVLCPSPEEL
ncbi:MAG: dihydrofolate reductase, partial [Firmicutes bacterium]|nr:dihydrofolate reductase [Bacillota bacterium]